MLMQYIFVVVLAVLVVLNVFMTVIVKRVAGEVSRQIRGDAERLFALYDRLLSKKSEALKGTSPAEIVSGAPQSCPSPAAEVQQNPFAPGAAYAEPDFVQAYQAVQRGFSFDKESLVRRAAAQAGGREGKIASEILRQLSFECVYRISLLPPPKQRALLEEVLSPEQRALLKKFGSQEKTFQVIHFYDWLRRLSISDSSLVQVRTSRPGESFAQVGSSVVTTYSSRLCGGIEIIADGKLYDFGIGEREIER